MLFFSFTIIIGLLGIFLGLSGRNIGNKYIYILMLFFFFLLILIGILILNLILKGGTIELVLFSWISPYFTNLNIGFLFDMLSISMSLVVSIISICVILYAIEYMGNDPHIIRFITLLLLFVFFMLFFVTSNNIVQSFIGWEGVGIISYLLINFWFTRMEANRSAFKAILFNRFGDLSYIIFFVIILYILKSSNFTYINSLFFILDNSIKIQIFDLEIYFYFLFLGAMCKSAQIGLHAWLPDAMEGPTPVSALLHSATMVTAGIYIFLRFAPILLLYIQLNCLIAIIGGITALMGATVAYFSEDIKKIIAYSTCSQLGILFSAIGIGNYNGCFFHIVTHAFFKALLFLTAGCTIHAVADEQDIRKMGGLLRYLPYTSICMLVGIFGLVGFPFLSGFYSKEFIIFFSLLQSTITGNFITILVFLASIFTMLYGLKLFFFIFLSNYRGYKSNLLFLVEPTILMSISIGLLSLLTIFAGYFCLDFLLYNNNLIWFSIFPPIYNYNDIFIQIETLSFLLKNSLFIIFIIFIIFFYKKINNILEWRLLLIKKNIIIQFIINFLNVFFFQTWMFNYIYSLIVYLFLTFSFNILLLKINNFIEYSFIINLKNSIYNISSLIIKSYSTNFFKNLFFIIVFLFLLLNFILIINIDKCLLLLFGFYTFCMFFNTKKNLFHNN